MWVALIAVAGVVAFGVLGTETLGVGFFDQPVLLDSDRPVRAVSYTVWNVDHETRLRVEATADPRLFACEPGTLRGDCFTARVMFTSRSRALRQTQVFHQSHLVVFAEFADGRRACRVVDIPPGNGRERVVVRLR
jgi:hypothetical protein